MADDTRAQETMPLTGAGTPESTESLTTRLRKANKKQHKYAGRLHARALQLWPDEGARQTA